MAMETCVSGWSMQQGEVGGDGSVGQEAAA
jgi:hypothetical protein